MSSVALGAGGLPAGTVVLTLIAAVLHATWNAMAHGVPDRLVGFALIGVSYTVINSLFSDNAAIGNGANPAKSGTPGGGSGGAIYNDGNTFTLSLCGTLIRDNTAVEGGGAIFFVSNDRSGSLSIRDSTLRHNPSAGFETKGFPGIFALAKGDPQVENSTLE